MKLTFEDSIGLSFVNEKKMSMRDQDLSMELIANIYAEEGIAASN